MAKESMSIGSVYSLIKSMATDPSITRDEYVQKSGMFVIETFFVNDKNFSTSRYEWFRGKHDDGIARLAVRMDDFVDGAKEKRNFNNQYIASVKIFVKKRPSASQAVVRHPCYVEFAKDDFGKDFNMISSFNESGCDDCKAVCDYIKTRISNDSYDKILSAGPGRAQEKSA